MEARGTRAIAQLYLEKPPNQNFYVNQQMPRIPGELVAKRTSQKKRAQIQRTQISSLPPHCN